MLEESLGERGRGGGKEGEGKERVGCPDVEVSLKPAT